MDISELAPIQNKETSFKVAGPERSMPEDLSVDVGECSSMIDELGDILVDFKFNPFLEDTEHNPIPYSTQIAQYVNTKTENKSALIINTYDDGEFFNYNYIFTNNDYQLALNNRSDGQVSLNFIYNVYNSPKIDGKRSLGLTVTDGYALVNTYIGNEGIDLLQIPKAQKAGMRGSVDASYPVPTLWLESHNLNLKGAKLDSLNTPITLLKDALELSGAEDLLKLDKEQLKIEADRRKSEAMLRMIGNLSLGNNDDTIKIITGIGSQMGEFFIQKDIEKSKILEGGRVAWNLEYLGTKFSVVSLVDESQETGRKSIGMSMQEGKAFVLELVQTLDGEIVTFPENIGSVRGDFNKVYEMMKAK